MAEVNGKPFLSYLLDQTISWGVKTVILCTGYQGDFIKNFYGNRYKSLSLTYSPEESPLGTGGALHQTLPLIQSDSLWVLNGDSYCDVDAETLLAQHQRKEAQVTIALTKVEDRSRYGEIELAADGSIIRFNEKGGESQPGWINGGIYLMNRSALESFLPRKPLSLERDIFPKWIGQQFFGFQQVSGRFLDIGTPDSFAKAEKFFL